MFQVTAKNQQNSSAPNIPANYYFQLNVTVDGAAKGTLSVLGDNTNYQTGSLAVTVPSGTHTVRYTWTNDVWQTGSIDTNLRLQQVAFVSPPQLPPQDYAVNSPAAGLIAESGSVINIQVSGMDTNQGTLSYQLLLDGQPVPPGTWTASPPASWVPAANQLGKHTLSVKVSNSSAYNKEDANDIFVVRTPVQHP